MLNKSVLCLAVLFAVLAAPALGGLVVRKDILDDEVIVDQNVTVTIDVWNTGDKPVYKVALDDQENWDIDSFERVSGSFSTSWDEIAAGEKETHTFQVRAQAVGDWVQSPRAKVTYANEPAGAQSTAWSTPMRPYAVLLKSNKPPPASAKAVQWGIYVLGMAVAVGLPYLQSKQ